jgi:hypothetical protein
MGEVRAAGRELGATRRCERAVDGGDDRAARACKFFCALFLFQHSILAEVKTS